MKNPYLWDGQALTIFDSKKGKTTMHAHWAAILNPLFSLFDEEVRQFLKERTGSIPQDSWLRTKRFRRMFDVFRGALERGFHFKNPLAETIKEKIVDYGDYLTGALPENGKEAGEKSGGPGPVIERRMSDFFNEAKKRIRESSDPETEFKKIELEFKLREKLLEMIEEAIEEAAENARKKEEARKAAQPPLSEAKPVIDWEKIRERFAELQEAFRVKVRENLPKANEAVDDAVLQFRAKQRWFKGRRARQDRLRNQLLERQERQTRDRVAELYDQFRRDWSDERGGQQ